jgi:hypothetical protein
MCAAKHHVCFTSKADSALGHVCFAPKADIPVVQAYRADLAGEVFYKPTPYWPVSSRIFLRACKTACGGDIENFRTKRVAMI